MWKGQTLVIIALDITLHPRELHNRHSLDVYPASSAFLTFATPTLTWDACSLSQKNPPPMTLRRSERLKSKVRKEVEMVTAIHSFIHSFIHSGCFYSVSASPLLVRG